MANPLPRRNCSAGAGLTKLKNLNSLRGGQRLNCCYSKMWRREGSTPAHLHTFVTSFNLPDICFSQSGVWSRCYAATRPLRLPCASCLNSGLSLDSPLPPASRGHNLELYHSRLPTKWRYQWIGRYYHRRCVHAHHGRDCCAGLVALSVHIRPIWLSTCSCPLPC